MNSSNKTVLMPLPAQGFDPTEAAISWKILEDRGHKVVVATPAAVVPNADPIMVTGNGLGILKGVLRADKHGRDAYAQFSSSEGFLKPLSYEQASEVTFDALVLPGGHAKQMRPYLESETLQHIVVRAFHDGVVVAAICHGVVLAARSIDPKTSRSVLHGRRVTTLPNRMERLAHRITKLWMGDYYRTYPETTTEDEVKACLASQEDFDAGPSGSKRDSPQNLSPGFFVRYDNLITARWPGDAHAFANQICDMLEAGVPSTEEPS